MASVLLVRCGKQVTVKRKFLPKVGFSFIPLGLAYLASSLLKNNHQCDILDFETCHEDEKETKFREYIKDRDFIGFSFLTPTFNEAIKFAQMAKKINPNIKTIFGGPHASFDFKNILEKRFADYIIIGEGEKAIVDLVSKKPLSLIKNLAYKKNNEIIVNEFETLDLNELPSPAREKCRAIRYKYYSQDLVMVSRGCQNKCSYCIETRLFGGVRYRNSDKIADEIELLVKNGKRNIWLITSNFTANKNAAMKILKEIIKRKLKVRLEINSCIETIDEKLIKLFKMAGGQIIAFGIESLKSECLRYIKKTEEPEKYRERVIRILELCNKIGVYTISYLIFGIPNQTKKDIINDIRTLKKLNSMVAISVLTPYPGSLEWDRVERMEDDMSKYDIHHMVFKSKLNKSDYDYIKKIKSLNLLSYTFTIFNLINLLPNFIQNYFNYLISRKTLSFNLIRKFGLNKI